MPIFLDTGFYFALISKKDIHHKKAQKIFKKTITGEFGKIYTSDFVLDESLTLMNCRTNGKRKDLLKKIFDLFLGKEPIAHIIKVNENWLKEIYIFQSKITKPDNPISFTDASNIILCQKLKIEKIIAYDEHYKGFLEIFQ